MSTVIVVKSTGGNPGKKPDSEKYKTLLNEGLRLLTEDKNPSGCLARLFPGGRVGMKTNCLAGRLNSTTPTLVDALSELLKESGIEENNIIVWERSNRELSSAGYKLNASSFGRRILGTDSNGVGYSRAFYSSDGVNSLISRILTDMIDYNINLPVLKDHSIAGLSGGLKNMYGAVHNPNKYHDNNCDPYAANISNLEPIRKKNRLTIIDAIMVQYNGGPGFDSRYMAYYGGILISEDPVAVDRVGLEILEYFRRINSLPPLEKVGRSVKYLKTAALLKLGMDELDKIEIKVIDVGREGKSRPGSLL